MSAVSLNNVTVRYNGRAAISEVTGTFNEGSLTAIAGPNGAGKSTLLKVIAGILQPSDGSITISGNGNNSIAYLPQAAGVQRDFPMTVEQMVATGFWADAGNIWKITSEMQQKIAAAIEAVGLKGLERQPIEQLSVGQFQRAMFARIIIQDAALVLLDEPFTAVDDATCHALMNIIRAWSEAGKTVICVSHDFHHIKHHFPHCMLLAHCCVAWGDSHVTLQEDHLDRAHREHRHHLHPVAI